MNLMPDYCCCQMNDGKLRCCLGACCRHCKRFTCHHRYNPGCSRCGSILCFFCLKDVEIGKKPCPECHKFDTKNAFHIKKYIEKNGRPQLEEMVPNLRKKKKNKCGIK